MGFWLFVEIDFLECIVFLLFDQWILLFILSQWAHLYVYICVYFWRTCYHCVIAAPQQTHFWITMEISASTVGSHLFTPLSHLVSSMYSLIQHETKYSSFHWVTVFTHQTCTLLYSAVYVLSLCSVVFTYASICLLCCINGAFA